MKTDGKRSWKFLSQVLIRINNNDVKKTSGVVEQGLFTR